MTQDIPEVPVTVEETESTEPVENCDLKDCTNPRKDGAFVRVGNVIPNNPPVTLALCEEHYNIVVGPPDMYSMVFKDDGYNLQAVPATPSE